eukprot:Hpha_TRINITY_DN16043_c1_g4::TRINITY_DN16043_c1_g4_i1::g.119260::m.119260
MNGKLHWNRRTGEDWLPWTMQKNRRRGWKVVPGRGEESFRICKCSKLPRYVSVMHAKCAPSCRKGYDPCTQHPTCRRVEDWNTCRTAATEMEWTSTSDGAASTLGGEDHSVRDILTEWNINFQAIRFERLRGQKKEGDYDSSNILCWLGRDTQCLRNTLWRECSKMKVWEANAGLVGGEDKYNQLLNDTIPVSRVWPEESISNMRWMDYSSNTYKHLMPPPLNFLGDTNVRAIPTGDTWSPNWTPPAEFASGPVSIDFNRPEGCSFRRDRELDPTFFPWNTLSLSNTEYIADTSMCCPTGTTHGVDCFVDGCSVQPCLTTNAGGRCEVHAEEVSSTWVLCECQEAASTDECLHYGQPCGVGQKCEDPDPSNVPGQQPDEYVCTCDDGTRASQGEPATGCPSVSPSLPGGFYAVAVPSGRQCPAPCTRIISQDQCDIAARQLGLPDTTSSVDPPDLKRNLPCGCHYSEHGKRCTSDVDECLAFNPVEGDGVYDGCDAYSPADAHNFIICACNESPQYQASPTWKCPERNVGGVNHCKVIDNKEDCKTAAIAVGLDRAVHEEQEAVLLMDKKGGPDKDAFNYTGVDNESHAYNDSSKLGPVVGDGPSRWKNRPPGCHYKRRFDADKLPNPAQPTWPHLFFNPYLESTVAPSTDDWALCDCSGQPPAPTPVPTYPPDMWANMS